MSRIVRGIAVTTALAVVLPVTTSDATDGRCRTDPVTASRCPTHAQTAVALPAWGLRSAVSPDGRRVVTVGSTVDYDRLAVASYDGFGRPLVSRRSYVGGTPWVLSTAFSPDGRTLIAAGEISDGGEGSQRLVVGVDVTTGALRWRRVSAVRGHNDAAVAVVADPAGRSVYVASELGEQKDGWTDDLLVEKLRASDGRREWAARVGRRDKADQYPVGIAFAHGHVVVVGAAQKLQQGTVGDYDDLVWVFEPGRGRLERQVKYDGGAGDDYPVASADNGDAVALTGFSSFGGGAALGIATLVFDAARMRWRWVSRIDDPRDLQAWTIAVGGGRVVVGAASGLAAAYSPAPYVYGQVQDAHDATAIAYDLHSGAQAWRSDLSVPGAPDAVVAQVAVSPDGRDVYWSGYAGATADWTYAATPVAYAWGSAPSDGVIVRLDGKSGAQQWLARWNSDAQGLGQVELGAVAVTGRAVVVSGAAYGMDPSHTRFDYTDGRGIALAYAR